MRNVRLGQDGSWWSLHGAALAGDWSLVHGNGTVGTDSTSSDARFAVTEDKALDLYQQVVHLKERMSTHSNQVDPAKDEDEDA